MLSIQPNKVTGKVVREVAKNLSLNFYKEQVSDSQNICGDTWRQEFTDAHHSVWKRPKRTNWPFFPFKVKSTTHWSVKKKRSIPNTFWTSCNLHYMQLHQCRSSDNLNQQDDLSAHKQLITQGVGGTQRPGHIPSGCNPDLASWCIMDLNRVHDLFYVSSPVSPLSALSISLSNKADLK